ncbi:MAG: hypothetical protein K1X75_17130 [Leptospirales bacterium]|nr:hypothetical protein [Leptospirales bacterium]
MRKSRFLVRIIALLALASCSSCFQILHVVELRQDGSVAIRFRFSIPTSILRLSRRGENSAAPGAPSTERFQENLQRYRDRLSADPEVRAYDTEQERVLEASLQAISLSRLEGLDESQEDFSVAPAYDASQSSLIFRFEGRSAAPRPDRIDPGDSGATSGANPGQNEQARQIAQALVGSAGYTLVLAGGFDPENARLQCGEQSVDIQIQRAGSAHIVAFPVFSHLLAHDGQVCRLRIKLHSGVALAAHAAD